MPSHPVMNQPGSDAEGKVRPLPGNSPHDRLVSRGILSPRRVCDDPFPAPPYPQLPRTILGAQYAFLKAGRNLSVRCGQNKTKPWGRTEPPPAGRPRAQVQERVGRTTPLSSSAMSSGRLFLDRVARQQSPSPLHRQPDHKTVDQSQKTNYHRMVTASFPPCLTKGVHPIISVYRRSSAADPGFLCSPIGARLIPRRQRPHGRGETRGGLGALFGGPLEHQGAQARHSAGTHPLTLVVDGELPGGEILQAE
jgi:hypothetical protein